MASEKGRQSPSPGLLPPPIAAPRRGRSSLGHSWSREGISSTASIPEDRTPPPIPPRPPSLKRMSIGVENQRGIGNNGMRSLGKSNSMYTPDNLGTAQAHQGDHRHSLPEDTGSSTFHPDLEGLDFSKVTSPDATEKAPTQKALYPDISHVFRGLKNSSPVPSNTQPLTHGMVPQGGCANGASQMAQTARNHMNPNHPPYHGSQASWNNQGLYGGMQVAGTSSMMSAAYPSHPSNSYVPPSASFGMNIPAFPSYQNSNITPQASGSSAALYSQNNQFNVPITQAHNYNFSQANMFHETSAAYDSKQPAFNVSTQNQFVQTFNRSYVPSAVFPPNPNLTNSYGSDHPIAVAGFDESFVPSHAQEDGTRDLINLGFPEQEYLSLSQFDPLYSRGRKESVSVIDTNDLPCLGRRDSEISFSFGEAFPNVQQKNHSPEVSGTYDSHSDEHIWTPAPDKMKQAEGFNRPIGFEAFDFVAFGHAKFGSSEEEFMNCSTGDGSKFVSPAYDAPDAKASRESLKSRKSPEIPPRPPSWIIPQVYHLVVENNRS